MKLAGWQGDITKIRNWQAGNQDMKLEGWQGDITKI